MPISGDGPNALAVQDQFTEHYAVLRRMARSRLRSHQTFTLLNTTGLLHESYLRLIAAEQWRPAERAAFLAYVGQVMRSVIVDVARGRLALRRGERAEHVDLDAVVESIADEPAAEIVHVHDALQALHASEPRLAQVLELQYFAGMTEPEIAACLDVSDRTVRRDSHRARLMLRALLA